MPSITIGLPECGFLENLPDVTFSAVTGTAYATVTFGSVTLIEDVPLTPDKQNCVVIYVKQMIRGRIARTRPGAFAIFLPRLQVQLRDDTETCTTSGVVIPGGIDKDENIDTEWLDRNFLTWQSQVIETTRQQPQWLAYIATRKYNVISTRLYAKDGRKFEKEIRTEIGDLDLRFRQLQTDFTYLWGRECELRELDPLAYDVYGQSSDTPTFYAQRYVLRPERYNDVCFGFENTVGGFDTIMLEGKQTFQPEGDVSAFKTNEVEWELDNAYTSIWEANTGRIETQRDANQFQDFLKSTNRYVLLRGTWRRIVVTEYKIKHYTGESNSYSFKYRLAERNECRFFDREELPEPTLPTTFFPRYDYKTM